MKLVRFHGNEEELARHAAACIIERAWKAVAERGRFTMALAGGSSPRRLYGMLAEGVDAFRFRQFGIEPPEEGLANGRVLMPHTATALFLGDERCVPPDDPASNGRMVEEALLWPGGFAREVLLRMEDGGLPPEEAARKYEEGMRTRCTTDEERHQTWPRLDIVLLGLGPDGHTASIFPGESALLAERQRWVLPVYAPSGSPPGWRITMTLPLINNARTVLFYVPGKEKALLADRIFRGLEPELPASMVQPVEGELLWFAARSCSGKTR